MGARCIQLTALLLSNLAAASLGLGIANVIAVYYFVYSVTSTSPSCQPSLSNTANCPYRNVVTLAFIGSGIWGSVAVFAVGILAIKSVAKQFAYRSIFLTATFVTAVVIIPTMIVLNAVNAALVTNENTASVLFNASAPDISTSGKVLLALPISVSGVGFLEMVVMSAMLVYTCLCFKPKPASKEPTAEEAQKPAENRPQPPPQPQPQSQPAPPPPPTQPLPGPTDPAAGGYYYPGPGPMAYSPYGPLPYRRPLAYGGAADYAGRLDPTSIYRPALRNTPYNMYPPSAARYPMARPYPLSYVPPSY